MKPEKATKILKDIQMDFADQMDADQLNSIQLGIEALKLYMALKATGGVPTGFSGIGETEQ